MSEVEDTHHRLAFVDAGAILKVPLFYLEGTYLNYVSFYVYNLNCSMVFHTSLLSSLGI